MPSSASRRRRAIAVRSWLSAGESTLIATGSFLTMSSARYTNDMPPSPIFRVIW